MEVLGVVSDGGGADNVGARGTNGAGDVGGAERGEVAAISDIWNGAVIRERGLEMVDAEGERHTVDVEVVVVTVSDIVYLNAGLCRGFVS